MRDRLSRMPEPAERVATAAASLGRRFTVEDLAALSGLSVPELLPPIRSLMQADLFTEFDGRLAFGHDLIRDAVRASVPTAVRRALDRRGADVLLARGALPVEVATAARGQRRTRRRSRHRRVWPTRRRSSALLIPQPRPSWLGKPWR